VDGLHHALEHGVEQLARLLGIAVGEQVHGTLQRIFSARCLGV
jgi:hypothetical protein